MNEETNKIKEKAMYILSKSALYMLLIMGVAISITTIGLELGIKISRWHFPVACVLAAGIIGLFMRKDGWKKYICVVAGTLIVLLIIIVLSGKVVDVSWDGNTYHKDAVGALKNGWNPYQEDYITFYKNSRLRDMDYLDDKIELTKGFWQTYYAKGTWYIAADIYAMTGQISNGKAYTIMIMFVLFGLVLPYLTEKKLEIIEAVLGGILVSCTPVTLIQMFSYYNDGVLALLLETIIISFLILMDQRCERGMVEKYLWVCTSIMIIIQVKFTGLGYAGFFCALLFVFWAYRLFKEKKYKEIGSAVMIFAATVIFSVVVVGWNPYVTNALEKGNPFYPLAGEGKVDIVSYNQPASFEKKNTIEKLVTSLFSYTDNIQKASGMEPKWKIPFHITKTELEKLSQIDLRIAGFGVLFSGILLLSILCIIGVWRKLYRSKKNIAWIVLGFLGVIIGLLSGISESWWARYSPYLYFVPLVALVLACLYDKGIWKQYVSKVIMLLLLLNSAFVVFYGVNVKIQKSSEEKQILQQLSNTGKSIRLQKNNTFVGCLYELDDRNISYQFVETIDKPDGTLMSGKIPYKLSDAKESR